MEYALLGSFEVVGLLWLSCAIVEHVDSPRPHSSIQAPIDDRDRASYNIVGPNVN
jgi:hypothetical protein